MQKHLFAAGHPVPQVDRTLLGHTQELERKFELAIGKLANASSVDLRIFFTMAHGYITGRIAQCVELFNNPNALMRLNDSFASEYLKAINGAPHADWNRAFRVCRQRAVLSSPDLLAYYFLAL